MLTPLAADSVLREREDRNVAALVAHIDALYEVLQGEVLPSPEAKVGVPSCNQFELTARRVGSWTALQAYRTNALASSKTQSVTRCVIILVMHRHAADAAVVAVAQSGPAHVRGRFE